MKKYIYKITNLINGKLYIGQAKNIQNRWYEHCLESIHNRKNQRLYNAIRKYGINNFKIEAIEGPIENYNEREIYWIAYYNTYLDKTKGYNMTPGGDEPPILKGEKSPFAKYDDDTIINIQQDLINNVLTYQQISNKYNISIEYLSCINRGISRRQENLNYPLRMSGNERKDKLIINEISYFLLYTTDSIEQIADNLKINSNTVYKVNKGTHIYCDPEITYPIRQPYARISTYLLNNIYQDLLDNKLKLSDIEQKYNLSKATINRINQGKKYKNNNFSYPLRPSNKRVYN